MIYLTIFSTAMQKNGGAKCYDPFHIGQYIKYDINCQSSKLFIQQRILTFTKKIILKKMSNTIRSLERCVCKNIMKLDVLSAKAERGLPPVRERERERERQRETERDSLIYTGTVMTVNMLIKLWSVLKRCHFYFFHDQ